MMNPHELDPDASHYVLDPNRLCQFLTGLQSGPRIHVDHAHLWRSFATAYPQHPQGSEGRRWLMAALRALEDQGHLRLPVERGTRWDRSSTVAVPLSIDLVRPTPAERNADWQTFPWHRSLQWVLQCRSLTADQVSFLRKVHDGLVSGAFAEPASFKYRSLQLTGDEKRLGSLVKSQLFDPGRLTLEAIGCEPDVLPLTWEAISNCRRMIIFENAGAFMMGLRVLRSMQNPPYGKIAYGCGIEVLNAAAYLRITDLEVDEIEYVGDLDIKGLEIAVSLQKVVASLGLPPLQPATALHAAMLQSASQLGSPDGWPAIEMSSHMPLEQLLAFLTEQLREPAQVILADGHRIPEEVLGHREMLEALSQKGIAPSRHSVGLA
jgi:hypothetical protein